MTSPVSETLSGLSLSDNPGLTSGNDTPRTQHTDAFPDARLATPHPPEDDSDVSNVDGLLQDEMLLDEDIESDPILHHIAHQQQEVLSSPFRARPVPANTFIEGVGPRLSKAAALRQGLEWDDPRDRRRTLGEETPVSFENVPGHKRSGLALNVASLAEPSLAPRQNRTALLRLGKPVEETVVKNVAEAAARNKARDLMEREQRRKSVALPLSLTNPEMMPRQNRAALLRLGQVPAPQGRDPKDVAEQAVYNKEKEAAERLAKRKSVAQPASLAAPSITPRVNRASMLRTGQMAPPPRLMGPPRPSTMFAPETSRSQTATLVGRTTAERFAADKAEKLARRSSMAPLRSLAAPVITPRANKASKLREGPGISRTPSRRSSTSSLTSMSTGTSKLNPSPVKAKYTMPSPKSRFTAPRPAPLPPMHKQSPSVSSEISAAVEAVSAGSASPPPSLERRSSIFRRLKGTSNPAGPRPTRSSTLREGLGAKIGNRLST